MKALSWWQPWGSAMFAPVDGVKTLAPAETIKPDETRHWPAPRWMIGTRVAIHAAKRDTGDERAFWAALPLHYRAAFAAMGIHEYADLPRGCLIGTGLLWRCRTSEEAIVIGSDNYYWGNFEPARFAWGFKDLQRFEKPIPCVGRQGIFDVDVEGLKSAPASGQGELF